MSSSWCSASLISTSVVKSSSVSVPHSDCRSSSFRSLTIIIVSSSPLMYSSFNWIHSVISKALTSVASSIVASLNSSSSFGGITFVIASISEFILLSRFSKVLWDSIAWTIKRKETFRRVLHRSHIWWGNPSPGIICNIIFYNNIYLN